jgi:hypothetical protein
VVAYIAATTAANMHEHVSIAIFSLLESSPFRRCCYSATSIHIRSDCNPTRRTTPRLNACHKPEHP